MKSGVHLAPASSEGRARRPPRVCRAWWHLILDPLISTGAARFAPGRGHPWMARLFTMPASPSWRAREVDWPPYRRTAPFGWARHPVTSVLTHAPIRTTPVALPAARGEAAPACDWHRSSRPARGRLESYRDDAPRRAPCGARLGWRRLRLRVSRCVPCGSPRRHSPVKAPGGDAISIMLRRASAWSGWWTPAPRYRCSRIEGMSPAAFVQSTVFNEHPRVAAISDLLAQSPFSSTWPCGPAALRGQVIRRRRGTPPRRGFGAPDSDGGTVGPCRRSRSGASRPGTLSRSGRRSCVWSHDGHCADRIFCGPCRASSPRTLLLTTCVIL